MFTWQAIILPNNPWEWNSCLHWELWGGCWNALLGSISAIWLWVKTRSSTSLVVCSVHSTVVSKVRWHWHPKTSFRWRPIYSKSSFGDCAIYSQTTVHILYTPLRTLGYSWFSPRLGHLGFDRRVLMGMCTNFFSSWPLTGVPVCDLWPFATSS